MGAGLAIYTALYDNAGNRTGLQELDGTRVTYVYDQSYQLINEQRSASGGGILTYDNANAYDIPVAYDGGGGIAAYNTTYLYDGAGNRTVKNDSGALTSYSYNAANELTLLSPPTGQPTTSLWDSNGNLLSENAGGQFTSYSWDGENQMVGVAAPLPPNGATMMTSDLTTGSDTRYRWSFGRRCSARTSGLREWN